MDFRKELAKWGYNKGNSIDVEILINEILPELFSKQDKNKYSEEEVYDLMDKREHYWVRYKNYYTQSYIPFDELFEQFKKK